MKRGTQLITPGFLKMNCLLFGQRVFDSRYVIIIMKPQGEKKPQMKQTPKGSGVLSGAAGGWPVLDPAVMWKADSGREFGHLDDISKQNVEGVAGLFLGVCSEMGKERDTQRESAFSRLM